MKKYQKLASLWYDGMYSALYCFATTGNVIDGLKDEIEECINFAKGTDKKQLQNFLNYIN